MPGSEADQIAAAGARDGDRLWRRLAALRAQDRPGPDGGRLLVAPDAMTAIAREIDETVLPRVLVFGNDRGERIGLEVASRRILSVALVDLAAGAQLPPDLVGHAFFDISDPLCDGLYTALARFAQDTRQVHVHARIVPEARNFSNIGIPLAALTDAPHPAPALGTDLPDGARFADFVALCRPLATALIRADSGGIRERIGDPEQVRRLEHLAADELAQAGDAPAQALLVGGAFPNAPFVLCMSCLSQFVFAQLAPGQVPAVLAAWQRQFGQGGSRTT